MSGNIKLNTPSSGSVTLSAADTASNLTATIPAATDTLVNLASSQSLSNKTITAANTNTVEATSGPTSTQLAGQRNKIINGAMMIDQRNAGASVATQSGSIYTVDRWSAVASLASKYSVQRNAGSITPPIGFTNYLGITSLSAYSVPSTGLYFIRQAIEGFNTADLNFGTSNAKTITLSFWVYSSLTGTFGGSLNNSAENRSYPYSYTISSANTWEQKSVTIAGDTTGTWLVDNGAGLYVAFSFGVGTTFSGTAGSWQAGTYYSATGATSVVGTNGATFYITGVQLEKGATATPFENRLYGAEMALCQRYYQIFTSSGVNYSAYGNGCWYSSTYGEFQKQFVVPMRSAPTATVSAGNTFLANGVAGLTPSGSPGPGYMTNLSARINVVVASGATGGYSFILLDAGSGASSMQFNAEL